MAAYFRAVNRLGDKFILFSFRRTFVLVVPDVIACADFFVCFFDSIFQPDRVERAPSSFELFVTVVAAFCVELFRGFDRVGFFQSRCGNQPVSVQRTVLGRPGL
jgi:hypothetical protein